MGGDRWCSQGAACRLVSIHVPVMLTVVGIQASFHTLRAFRDSMMMLCGHDRPCHAAALSLVSMPCSCVAAGDASAKDYKGGNVDSSKFKSSKTGWSLSQVHAPGVALSRFDHRVRSASCGCLTSLLLADLLPLPGAGRGPLAQDWEKSPSTKPIMCCYKVVRADCKIFGLQGTVENAIINQQVSAVDT